MRLSSGLFLLNKIKRLIRSTQLEDRELHYDYITDQLLGFELKTTAPIDLVIHEMYFEYKTSVFYEKENYVVLGLQTDSPLGDFLICFNSIGVDDEHFDLNNDEPILYNKNYLRDRAFVESFRSRFSD